MGFPAWDELVEKIAKSDSVKGEHLLAATDGVSATAQTQMLLHHFRTKRLDELAWERVVHAFDLLQAGDVRLALLQPCQQVIQALADRVHVPGGDAHEMLRYQAGRR